MLHFASRSAARASPCPALEAPQPSGCESHAVAPYTPPTRPHAGQLCRGAGRLRERAGGRVLAESSMNTTTVSRMSSSIDRHLTRHVIAAVGGMLLIFIGFAYLENTVPSPAPPTPTRALRV